MIQSVLGNLYFNTGWKTNSEIVLFGNSYRVTVKARAYFETDGLTDEQQKAFADYKDHNSQREKEVEALLSAYAKTDCSARFFPRTLLFERNGGYALLCDDKDNPDDGVAVILSPDQRVILQDEYL